MSPLAGGRALGADASDALRQRLLAALAASALRQSLLPAVGLGPCPGCGAPRPRQKPPLAVLA